MHFYSTFLGYAHFVSFIANFYICQDAFDVLDSCCEFSNFGAYNLLFLCLTKYTSMAYDGKGFFVVDFVGSFLAYVLCRY